MKYENNLSPAQLNYQLLVGLKKHLIIAETTSNSKSVRLTSLNNISEVLEFVIENLNDSLNDKELVLLDRFFRHLLSKIVKAKITIHSEPMKFADELGYINILLQM